MIFINKTRCKACHEDRAVRFCPKTNKKICWKCCNSTRYDFSCPSECEYSIPKNEDDSLQFNLKNDSLKESNDITMKLFDYWALSVHKEISDKSPHELSHTEEGREVLEKYFSRIEFLSTIPINRMRKRLSLPAIEYNAGDDFEKFAETILEHSSLQEWDNIIEHYYKPELIKTDKYRPIFIKRNKTMKLFKKINEFEIISSSLNKEGNEALVHLDVNKKAEITLNITKIDGVWKLKSRILGDPQLYYGEDQAIKHIAGLITKNELVDVYDICKKYSTIYPDSADIEYYWGLYHALESNIKEATKHYEISYMLDPDFIEPLYNIGFILQVNHKNEEALEIYKEVLTKEPNDLKSLNNIAIMHIEKEEWEKAIDILENCLKIDPTYDVAEKNIELIKKKLAE